MRQATAALQAYVAANEDVVMCDLYTFALVSGQTLRYCAYPLPQLIIPAANFPTGSLNYAASGNQTFLRGPRFGRSKVTTKVGTTGNECDIGMLVGSGDIAFSGLAWSQVAQIGLFDGATVEIDRFFMPPGGDGITGVFNYTLGAIIWFYGRVGDLDISSTKVMLKAYDFMSLLEKSQMPRRIFQPPCNHIFGDNMCLFNRASMAQTVTALSGSNPSQLVTSFTPSPTTLYNQGTATGLTGANAGIKQTIGFSASGTFSFYTLFPYAISPGDTFQLLPGCDHTVATCNSVFNNLIHFGGYPYIPPPELAL
jgi:hypothetical protein